MAGYYKYSMSNNAVAAYESGEKPWSKWTKAALLGELANSDYLTAGDLAWLKSLKVNDLKLFVLEDAGWHHTSKYYNRTAFYSVKTLTSKDIKEEKQFRERNKRYNAFKKACDAGEVVITDLKGKQHKNFNLQYGFITDLDIEEKQKQHRESFFNQLKAKYGNLLDAYFSGDLVSSLSGTYYPAGRKPSQWDYDNLDFYKDTDTRLLKNGILEKWDGGLKCWIRLDWFKPIQRYWLSFQDNKEVQFKIDLDSYLNGYTKVI